MRIIITEAQVKKLVNSLKKQDLTKIINDPKEVILVKKKTNG